jgi:parallel beta-helix repeat protein
MKKVSLLLELFVCMLLILLFTVPVNATTLEVGESKAYTSIQTAINDAVTGDTVLVYDGTYVGNISIMGKSITVRSVNGANSTIIDGNGNGTVVNLINGEGPGSAVDGFTITKGNNGGIYCYSSSVTITNSTISGNTANSGGGILSNSCALTITNSTISGNTAGSQGGGIYYVYTSSSSTITNSTITGNTANSGGGGIAFAYSSPTITNSTITGNTTNYQGGGIYCASYSSPIITNSTITENTVISNDVESYGGGIYIANYSSPTITNSTITGNTAISNGRDCYGGGICCIAYSSPTITNSTITGNSAVSYAGSPFGSYGGGICSLNDSSPKIKNSILWGDSATTGNEIYLDNSSINVTYSDVDQDGDSGSNGNIRQDPLFVDPENGDFHLQPDSPCIDAGTSDGAPSTDMESFPRYDEPLVPNTGGGTYSYYDMGAYENQVRVVSPTEGTIGTRITITGSGFGDKKGKVLINGIAAKIAKGDWSENQIICTIKKPPFFVDVAHPVYVVVNRVSIPLDGTFALKNHVLDDLVDSSGAYPETITVTGKFFSTRKGKVYLYDPVTEKKKNLRVMDWKMNETTGVSELTFLVPKPSKRFPAGPYQLKVVNRIGTATASKDFTLEPLPLP